MCDTEGDPKFAQFHVDDVAIVPSIAAHVHSLPGNLMLNWIPYYDVYNAEWATKWGGGASRQQNLTELENLKFELVVSS